MNILICGSRTITNCKLIFDILNESKIDIEEIISGGALGVDRIAEIYSGMNEIPIKIFPAKWDLYGKAAGLIRNKEMLEYIVKNKGIVIAFWCGKSRGTKHMIEIARKVNIKVIVYYILNNEYLVDTKIYN